MMETIKQKLMKLANTRTLVKVVIKDSAGDDCQYDGALYHHKDNGAIFTILSSDVKNKDFRVKDVERLSVMTTVWCKVNVRIK